MFATLVATSRVAGVDSSCTGVELSVGVRLGARKGEIRGHGRHRPRLCENVGRALFRTSVRSGSRLHVIVDAPPALELDLGTLLHHPHAHRR